MALGCGGPDSKKLAGEWRAEDAEATKAFGKATYVDLHLKPDFSARLLTDEGKWHMEGEEVVFETEETKGSLAFLLITLQLKPAQSIRLQLNGDDTMTWAIKREDGSVVKSYAFHRKSAP